MQSTYIKLGIGLLLFVTWLLLVIFQVQHADDIISAIKTALIGLGAYHLGDKPAVPAPLVEDKTNALLANQAGRANPFILLAIAVIASALFGCAGFQQAVSAYQASAIKGIQAAEDNNIALWAANACGTPFSAAVRHPELIGALKALCLPAGGDVGPSMLFDMVPVKK